MARVLVIGATSAIAEATCRRFAARGDDLYLLGRDETRLASIARDMEERGAASVTWAKLDVTSQGDLLPAVARARDSLGEFDIALIAQGVRPDQNALIENPSALHDVFLVNTLSVMILAEGIIKIMEDQGQGRLAVITSLAGERGRKTNYAYGASKAAVDAFLEGLRQRLGPGRVTATTIKPGSVDTPMTKDKAGGAFQTDPETVAAGIERAIDRRRPVVYLPWYWRWISLGIRLIPEPIYRRLYQRH